MAADYAGLLPPESRATRRLPFYSSRYYRRARDCTKHCLLGWQLGSGIVDYADCHYGSSHAAEPHKEPNLLTPIRPDSIQSINPRWSWPPDNEEISWNIHAFRPTAESLGCIADSEDELDRSAQKRRDYVPYIASTDLNSLVRLFGTSTPRTVN